MNTSFERTKTGKDEWLTPPELLSKLGKFDLDVCAPKVRPFETARNYYTIDDDGLTSNWYGRVWCNPPYGTETAKWLRICKHHNNAIALIFARTETKMFFDCVWNSATAVLFIKGRLKFYHVDGTQGDSAGAPSVLVAYGKENADVLEHCGIAGKFIRLIN